MFDYRRTHTCGELRKEDIGKEVTLSGWVHLHRNLGGLIFIDIRDRYGFTQAVFDPEVDKERHAIAETFRSEWVVSVKGTVIARADGMANSSLDTGDIEVEVSDVAVLSKSKTPPFSVCDEVINVNEELRLRYRYLDVRRGGIIKNLALRHSAMLATRNFFDSKGFMEIQTPILGKSTPEGARDYLVPSRIYPGSFYALPQSPQIFKQLLMVSGLDKYFQIAPCFRDEDLRADRQPEFTQIDMEMSFSTTEELFDIIEGLVATIFDKSLGVTIGGSFQRLTYDECIGSYGTDKPDLRFGMKLITLDDIAKRSTFSIFLENLKGGNTVKGLCVKGGTNISRRQIDEYTAFVGEFGVKGLAWMKRNDEGVLTSSIVKFFDEGLQQELIDALDIAPGDLIFIVADEKNRTNQALDHLRRRLAKDRDLIEAGKYEFLWVTDYPLMSWNAEEERLDSEHHPFTAPHPEDAHLLDSDATKVRSLSYDLVVNGYELASGSQRIHDEMTQKKIFELLKLSEEEIQGRFGFFVEALNYGTPPHIGIGIGFDRLLMVMIGTENIRDVIAFPKTQKASDLMSEAPSAVDDIQLQDLKITIKD
ncbi:MAG: aspartate--tRNA ligase [Waddliaceae bacterium]|jgi:aspartyl-tRNA synthetase|nr:aspartate--tRNA ligase [Waddliaceae bacterium]MBT3578684.1 aspartate--tRNA ligase [Waddliaceae bacterium]MBT6928329.1 aspartate--tRNA ligase [Waddliaceae bacterium]MBT7265015.1 aspartate--tRNA ligase [Waddliaceae bacterium]MBT7462155.1 aspartate--tRNA ligase [Waddliaceae bacterium]